jgi:hypothetical protein
MRWDRIEFGRIKEVNSLFYSIVHLLMTFGFSILASPGHSSQTYFTYFQGGMRQGSIDHSLRFVLMAAKVVIGCVIEN